MKVQILNGIDMDVIKASKTSSKLIENSRNTTISYKSDNMVAFKGTPGGYSQADIRETNSMNNRLKKVIKLI